MNVSPMTEKSSGTEKKWCGDSVKKKEKGVLQQ
jgi:hypothetical protein